MPRKRVISPSIWTDEKFIELDYITRLLFIGIWNYCCDRGIHKNNAKALKAEIFPADDITVDVIEKGLSNLFNNRQLLISEDKALFRVANWDTYQKIQHKTRSKYEDDDGNITIAFAYHNGSDTITLPYNNGSDTIPLQHNINNITNIKESNINKVQSKVQNEDFELFYSIYPRKESKKKAIVAFNNLTKKNQKLCIEAIPGYVQYLKSNNIDDKRLIKLPTTYIHGEHWNDELDIGGPGSGKYRAEDYKLDAPQVSRIGYCTACYRSDFYDKLNIHNLDSKCCNSNLTPTKEG